MIDTRAATRRLSALDLRKYSKGQTTPPTPSTTASFGHAREGPVSPKATGIFKRFCDECSRYEDREVSEVKMQVCQKFCAMMGLSKDTHCSSVAQSMLALTVCGIDEEEARDVLAFALVNLNKQWSYLAELRGADRAFLAVTHVYIAQSCLHDDFVPFSVFHSTCFEESYSPKQFFRHIIATMKKWDNRVCVTPSDLASAAEILSKS